MLKRKMENKEFITMCKKRMIPNWIIGVFFVTCILLLPKTIYAKEYPEIKKWGDLINSSYSLTGGIEIKDSSVYVLKASSKNPSDVGLFMAKIKKDNSLGNFKCIKKFKDAELGHGNDCTFYNDFLFVAPYGSHTQSGVKSYYKEGAKLKDSYYPLVAINMASDTYEPRGYHIRDKNGVLSTEGAIAGISYIEDKMYKGYPVFCLKGSEGKTIMCYLSGDSFYEFFSCQVIQPNYSEYGNRNQGLTYHEGVLYYGLGILNEKQVCDGMAYICQITYDSLEEGKSNLAETAFIKDCSEDFTKFEIEGIVFWKDYCVFSTNARVQIGKKTYDFDGIYFFTREKTTD